MASSSSSRILFYDDVINGTTMCLNVSCYAVGSILPAPIAIPPLPYDPTPTPIQIHHANRLLPNFLIAAASLLALSFLLLLVSYFLLRLRRRRRRRLLFPAANNDDHQNPPPFPLQDLDLVEQEEDGGDGTHHIWYIRTVGLEESVIKSIASTVYKSGGGLMDGGDCSVCLGEFVDGEVIKLLPKCSHAFHLPCIDTWLRSHVNCPLCRSPVVVVTGELDDAGPSEETLSPPATITRGGEENAVVVDLEAGSSSSSNSRKEENENDNGGELQPIRRSVSLDSSSLGVLMLRVELPDEKLGEEMKKVEMREVVAPKNEGKGIESLAKWSAEMKRSLSSRSGRLFFTRYARGRSASVLPL